MSIAAYEPTIPADSETTIRDPALRKFLVRMLMPLPLVGGGVSKPRIAVVRKVASRLDAEDEELELLDRAASRSWFWFMRRLMRHGVEEYWNTDGRATWRDWLAIIAELIRPGMVKKPETAERYRALRTMPPETLGGTLAQYYIDKGLPVPGEKDSLNEKFVLHDVYHILSGYMPERVSPSPDQPGSIRGEMLVSVFTGGNKAYHPMDWVIAPLLQWHCGAPVITFKRRYALKGLLDPNAYFHALRRGMEMRVNLMDRWSWWDHIHERVDEIRSQYRLPALEPMLDGTHEPPRELFDGRRPAGALVPAAG